MCVYLFILYYITLCYITHVCIYSLTYIHIYKVTLHYFAIDVLHIIFHLPFHHEEFYLGDHSVSKYIICLLFHKCLYHIPLPEGTRIYLTNPGNWFLISKGYSGRMRRCSVQNNQFNYSLVSWGLFFEFLEFWLCLASASSHSLALSSPFYLQKFQQI